VSLLTYWKQHTNQA